MIDPHVLGGALFVCAVVALAVWLLDYICSTSPIVPDDWDLG